MRWRRASWWATRSGFHRTTERSAWRSTRRSSPSSVAFCTIQSSRSPFGIAAAIVTGWASAGSTTIGDVASSRSRLVSPTVAARHQRPAPSVALTGSPSRRRRTRRRWCSVSVSSTIVGPPSSRSASTRTWAFVERNADRSGLDISLALSGECRLDPREQAFLAVADHFASTVRIAGEQVDLVVGELGRDVDADPGAQVASTAATQVRDPALAQHELAAGLRAGRHDQVLGAVECLEFDLRAECSLRDRHRHFGDEVVILAQEQVVGCDAQVDVEISGTATTGADRTATAEPQRGTGVDTGRHIDLVRLVGGDTALAPARGARGGHDLAEPAAPAAGAGGDHR